MTEADRDTLRTRLTALRAYALDQLGEADTLDSGLLRIIADVSAVLAALEDEAAPLAADRTGAAQ